jgi:hypothetical protein
MYKLQSFLMEDVNEEASWEQQDSQFLLRYTVFVITLEAISHWFLAPEARIQSQGGPFAIYIQQSGRVIGFFPEFFSFL